MSVLLVTGNFAVKTMGRFVYGVSALLLLIHLIFFVSLFTTQKAHAKPQLLAQHEKLKTELAQSIFGSPIVLISNTSKHHAHGEVFAKLDTPIAVLEQTLTQPKHWCDFAILHINIKSCTYHDQQLQFYVGRKYYQPPSQAYPFTYTFDQLETGDSSIHLELTAGDGPFGTHDYSITFEAVPIDNQTSFIHFQYRYHFGLLARVAMNTYLATIGRHKVGFTIDGTDIKGDPAYVGGIQGIVERNTIRYIYAIQSLLDTRNASNNIRQQKSLERWYEKISKHPIQLVEFTLEEYLERKSQEIENQAVLQKALLLDLKINS